MGEILRITRTLRTAIVLAVLALNRLANKERLALMASPAHTLSRYPPCHLLSRRTVRHRRGCFILRIAIVNSDNPSGKTHPFRSLRLLTARALLTPSMLAIAADFLGTKRGLATMACAMDPQTDLLFHAWCTSGDGRSPFARFEGETILGEHCLGFLLLNSAGLLGVHAYDRRRSRLVVLDDLRYLRGD